MTTNTETKEPNPYNAHKPWHDEVESTPMQNANYAFVPENRKRKKKEEVAPVVPAPQTTEVPEDGSFVNAKRYYDLKKHHDKTVTTLRSELDELKRLVQGTPAEAVTPVVEQKPNDQTPPVVATPVVTKSDEPVVDEKELRAKKAEAKVAILEAHPDFTKVVNDTEFHEWAESQTDEVKEWIYDNPFDAAKAIEALNLYKAHIKAEEESRKTKQDSKAQVGADAIVSTRTTNVTTSDGKRAWKPEDIKNMSVSDWEKHREDILGSLRGLQL